MLRRLLFTAGIGYLFRRMMGGRSAYTRTTPGFGGLGRRGVRW